jgi:phage tail sheath protein FI
MPVTLPYPGVYIEEIPSGVHTITEVATSIAAFIGYFKRGSMQEATHILSFADFEREFGTLDVASEASYAIQQFFLNGGTEAYVVRTAAANTAIAAAIAMQDLASGGTSIVKVTAISEGDWGNNVRVDIDYNTTDPTSTFNLIVTEMVNVGGRTQPGTSETFRNLILDPTKSNDAQSVVNDGSRLIQLSYMNSPTPSQRPAATGTVDQLITTAVLPTLADKDKMDVNLNVTNLGSVTLAAPLPTTLAALASTLTSELRAVDPQLQNAVVNLLGSVSTHQYLQVKAGTGKPSDILHFSGGLATKLGLDDAKHANVQQYVLGGGAEAAQALPGLSQQAGNDGNPPTATELSGDPVAKTGMYMLQNVDLFNILCIPDTMNLSDAQAAQVAAAAEAYCDSRRAFYILDAPQKDHTRDQVDRISQWLDENATLRDRNAALYFPRPQIADPLNDFRLRLVATSGVIAGLYARIDAARGVWKAPAGTEANLRGVQALAYTLTDPENGVLNPLAINCLRRFPIFGNVIWGARTLVGADQMTSEWKYVPVRRMALFLEESLYRGTKWVVFEPNDEPLWSQIRLNVGSFMHDLFRQGAFQGKTPREAYFVKCDSETTTQSDIDHGIVNILVGFAPLKPAEFVVIKIQQIAGQIAT